MSGKNSSDRDLPAKGKNDGAEDEQTELALDTEIADAATPVPDSGENGEGGKLKMIVQVLKRCLGVKDLAAMYVFDTVGIDAWLMLFTMHYVCCWNLIPRRI